MRVVEKINTEILDEFTKTEICSLFPDPEVLQNIRCDHDYTDVWENQPEISKELDSSDEVIFHKDDVHFLDADWIQTLFKSMINMTSLNTITGETNEQADKKLQSNKPKRKSRIIKTVKFVDELPQTPMLSPAADENPQLLTSGSEHDAIRKISHTSTSIAPTINDRQDKTENKYRNKRSLRNSNEPGSSTICLQDTEETPPCEFASEDELRTAVRCVELERDMNVLVRYTAELLVRRWRDYLTMTTEQIAAFEIDNAKDHNMIEDVVDMLEDKDRYVWQLIEDIQFF